MYVAALQNRNRSANSTIWLLNSLYYHSILLHRMQIRSLNHEIRTTMQTKIIQMIPLLLFTRLNQSCTEDTIESAKAIHFVVTRTNYEECSFSLSPTETFEDLQRKVVLECGFQHPLEIQVSGETIIPCSSTNQIITKNPAIAQNWRMLNELWSPDKNFRIPLRVQQISTAEEIAVYRSLLDMFRGIESNFEAPQWYLFLHRGVERKTCSAQNLCDQFNFLFICNNGELKEIHLNNQRMSGIIDLSPLPPTVTLLNVERNQLRGIIGLDELTGKQLYTLKIRRNPLSINLRPLVRSAVSSDNPLRSLWVGAGQIIHSLRQMTGFDEKNTRHREREAAQHWIDFSVLDYVMMGWGERCSEIRRRETRAKTMY